MLGKFYLASNDSQRSPFYLDKRDRKIGHYIAIEKGRRQPSLDDQKPNLGYVCIGDGYFYSNTPASIHQAPFMQTGEYDYASQMAQTF